ncbi:sugar ABC transporter ATP-binding protein, partial [Burkholderia cenocepacia]
IYTLMGALAREGRALVVVSSDLRELMLICDRIGVMSAGRMTAVFERGNWTQDALLAAAFAGFGRETPAAAMQHPDPEHARGAAPGTSTTGRQQ